jgi:hypothetical protein
MTSLIDRFKELNPFGSTLIQDPGENTARPMTYEEYESWVQESSKAPMEVSGSTIRKCREFAVWLFVPPAAVDSTIQNACSTQSFSAMPISAVYANVLTQNDLISHDTKVSQYMSEFWELATSKHYSGMKTHKVLFKDEPNFLIILNEINDPETVAPRYAALCHPHISAPTAHELLRVVYEWNWAYEELKNTEPAAGLCNQVWKTLNPPEHIVTFIQQLPDMAVAAYIKGSNLPAEPRPEDPEVSLEFVEWWMSVICVV